MIDHENQIEDNEITIYLLLRATKRMHKHETLQINSYFLPAPAIDIMQFKDCLY